MIRKPTVAIVGAGSLATFLALALRQAGYSISEIVTRDSLSRPRTQALATKVGARVVTAHESSLSADLIWFCVPDRAIRAAASVLAAHFAQRAGRRKENSARFAFHTSGALGSRELDPLRKAGVSIASVHPLMTFVPRSSPSLAAVPFALEGEAAAVRVARRIVRDLGGKSFSLSPKRKAAYHAWATMTSPLLLAYLVTLEEAASAAGLRRKDARRMSLPIIRQTLQNYGEMGPQHSFSGPFIRGDADTVAKHLELLKRRPGVHQVYLALAEASLRRLPVRNRKELTRLLRSTNQAF